MTKNVLFAAVATCMMATQIQADDWPQWMGPKRDAVWRESGIVDKFPADGLPVLWRVPVEGGYSGPAVANGKVYLTDYVKRAGDGSNDPGRRNQIQGTERVLCFDAKDGKLLWKHEYDCPYNISYPAGPRATPTVVGELVYTLGSEGHLICLNADSGDVIWSKEFKKEFGIEAPVWGFTGHPLVDGDSLICLAGGQGSIVVAYDRKNGTELWRALSASEPGYCPPSIIEAGGKRQLIVWHADAINGLNPANGEVYWTQPLKPNYGMSIMVPQMWEDYLFASGIGNVGALFKLDREKPGAEVVWQGTPKTAVYCANSTPHIENGVIYGVDCMQGSLRGVDLLTGDRLWETFKPTTGNRRASHGTAFLVKHEDRYFLFSETGDLILAKLSPKGYEEISRFHVLEPTGDAFGRDVVWTHPAFANKCCYARNDKELVCVSLAAE